MDNRGSTLIENVISIFLLAIFATMASFSVISGMTAFTNTVMENQRLYDIYTQLECKQYNSEKIDDTNMSLTFDFPGNGTKEIDTDYLNDGIEGKMHYDKDKKLLGEFVH